VWQERILLSFVESVDFVDEQDCAELQVPVLSGVLDYAFNIFLPACHGRKLGKLSVDLLGDYTGQCRLACAGRTPEYQTDRLLILNDFPQDFIAP
jgi:hypothetical protein